MLPSETLVYQSRRKLLIVLIASLALTATAVWLLTGEVRHRFSHPLLMAITSGVGVVLFGLASIGALAGLVRPRLALTLDDTGLFDHARNGFGLVPWGEILGVATSHMAGNRLLVIRVRDPQTFIDRSPRWRHTSLKMNLGMLGSPVVVSAAALDIGADSLLALCRRYHERSVLATTAQTADSQSSAAARAC